MFIRMLSEAEIRTEGNPLKREESK